MNHCRFCGAPIRRQKAFLSQTEQWIDIHATMCGAFCPAVEGREHEPEVGRSYSIGLPVMFTVQDDGTVTVDVDLAEVCDLDEDEQACKRYPGLQVTRDILTVSEAAGRVGNTHTFTLQPTTTEAS